MKKMLAVVLVTAVVSAFGATYSSGGYTWYYERLPGGALVYGVKPAPSGTVSFPSSVGGTTVRYIGFGPCRAALGDAWFDFSKATGFSIPTGVQYVDSGNFRNSKWWNDQPDGVLRIGEWAVGFKGDADSLTVPSGVRKIAVNAFMECAAWNVFLPTGLTHICAQAFYMANRYMRLEIPASVVSVGEYAFDEIETVYFLGPRPAFSSCEPDAEPYGELGAETVFFKRGPSGWTDGGSWGGAETAVWDPPASYVSGGYTWYYGVSDGEAVLYGVVPPPVGAVTFPATVGGFSVKAIGYGPCMPPPAMYDFDFSGVTGFTIPSGVRYLDSSDFRESRWWSDQPDGVLRIGEWAVGFKGDAGSLTVPSGVRKIAVNAFWGSEASRIVLPSGLTHLCSQAFYGAAELRDLIVPATVTSVGDGAFYDIPGPVYFLGAQPKVTDCSGDTGPYGGYELGRCDAYFKPGQSGWTGGGSWWGMATRAGNPPQTCVSSTCRITFSAGGGTGSMTDVTRTVNECSVTTYTLPACTFTRTGWEFRGWFVTSPHFATIPEEECGEDDLRHPGNPIDLPEDGCGINLKAMWKRIPGVYSVNFDLNGASGSVAPMACNDGTVYRLPVARRTGYVFLGWAGSDGRRYDGETLVFNLGGKGERVTMTAVWKAQ